MQVADEGIRPGSNEGAPIENPDEFQIVSLYESWRKIQYLWVKGRFQSLRRFALSVLVAVFYLGPWLRWEGRQAIWLNLPERKFAFWATTFWPQDFVLLALLLVIAAFTLFVFTVAAGRLWCGFACPQTVWTLCYVWIERKIEGERNQRIEFDEAPWTSAKLWKKSFKFLLWAILALSISITFVGYFTPIETLLREIAALSVGTRERFAILSLAGASFLFSGVLREQVCLHMCPYARFQSVMFDRDTLIVSYDARRGEPLHAVRRNFPNASIPLNISGFWTRRPSGRTSRYPAVSDQSHHRGSDRHASSHPPLDHSFARGGLRAVVRAAGGAGFRG